MSYHRFFWNYVKFLIKDRLVYFLRPCVTVQALMVPYVSTEAVLHICTLQGFHQQWYTPAPIFECNCEYKARHIFPVLLTVVLKTFCASCHKRNVVLDYPVSKFGILFVKGINKWKYTQELIMRKKGQGEKKEKGRKDGMGISLYPKRIFLRYWTELRLHFLRHHSWNLLYQDSHSIHKTLLKWYCQISREMGHRQHPRFLWRCATQMDGFLLCSGGFVVQNHWFIQLLSLSETAET